MGFLLSLLTLPVLGGPRMAHWLAQTIAEEAEREALDEEGVRGELLELQEQYDSGDIEAKEYDQQEKALLERLGAIRDLKAQRGK